MSQVHEVLIIPAATGDASSLLPVYLDCQDFLQLGPVSTIDLETVQKDLTESAEQAGQYYAVLVNGRPAGVADLRSGGFGGDPQVGFINLLMIGQAYRGAGVGRAALQLVEAEICTNPAVSQIQLAVQTNNPTGIGFWEHMGYERFTQPAQQPDGTTTCMYRKAVPSD